MSVNKMHLYVKLARHLRDGAAGRQTWKVIRYQIHSSPVCIVCAVLHSGEGQVNGGCYCL